MGVADPILARWPNVPAGRGHYESYYVRAVHPGKPLGLWIRYTVTIPPGGTPSGQLWCTLFDRSRPRPWAMRVDAGPVATDGEAWIRLGSSSFGPGGIVGEVTAPEGAAGWSLRTSAEEQPLMHLPSSWMYGARLPRTKLTSPAPIAMVDGTLEVDGTTIRVDAWPGMVGHNWGEQHAEQWVWLHGLGFDGFGMDTWLDVAIGRVRLGRWVTPWVANGVLSLDGERLPLGGIGRRVSVTASSDRCDLRIPGPKGVLTASAAAPPQAFAEWDYANPDGSMHRVLNCSVADLTVRVERPRGAPVVLTAAARAAYELGRPSEA